MTLSIPLSRVRAHGGEKASFGCVHPIFVFAGSSLISRLIGPAEDHVVWAAFAQSPFSRALPSREQLPRVVICLLPEKHLVSGAMTNTVNISNAHLADQADDVFYHLGISKAGDDLPGLFRNVKVRLARVNKNRDPAGRLFSSSVLEVALED